MKRIIITLLAICFAGGAFAQTTTVTLHPNDGLWNFSSLGVTLTSGQLLLPDGTAAKPSLGFASAPTSGFYLSVYPRIAVNGVNAVTITPSTLVINGTGSSLQFNSGDTILARGAANTLYQKNGVNAQAFWIANSDDGAGNYERGFLRWATNKLEIGTEAAGSGAARGTYLLSATGNIWAVGSFLPSTADARDLGDGGTYLFRTAYISRSIQGSKTKALTEGAETAVTQIAVPQTALANFADANIEWGVYAADATDSQRLRGTAVLAAVNKAGTETCAIVAGETAASALSAGTLTCTPTCIVGLTDVVQFALNCTSSLTQTTLSAQVFVEMLQPNTLTPQ